MFWPEDVGGMEEWWECYATRRMYLRITYSASQEQMMQNVSEAVLCSKGSKGSENLSCGLFRYFLNILQRR